LFEIAGINERRIVNIKKNASIRNEDLKIFDFLKIPFIKLINKINTNKDENTISGIETFADDERNGSKAAIEIIPKYGFNKIKNKIGIIESIKRISDKLLIFKKIGIRHIANDKINRKYSFLFIFKTNKKFFILYFASNTLLEKQLKEGKRQEKWKKLYLKSCEDQPELLEYRERIKIKNYSNKPVPEGSNSCPLRLDINSAYLHYKFR